LEKVVESQVASEAKNEFDLIKWFGGLILKKPNLRPTLDLKEEIN